MIRNVAHTCLYSHSAQWVCRHTTASKLKTPPEVPAASHSRWVALLQHSKTVWPTPRTIPRRSTSTQVRSRIHVDLLLWGIAYRCSVGRQEKKESGHVGWRSVWTYWTRFSRVQVRENHCKQWLTTTENIDIMIRNVVRTRVHSPKSLRRGKIVILKAPRQTESAPREMEPSQHFRRP